eukprot:TRINITY_DN1080_c0_g1_i1.p1 TRINITY_DN1080_c0_g1~~TRINITY_DN1080_c0_g1_i1.p1  ORF type:complete len:191 (-),score=31.65 TRINITY_DN1080_c0_g1_i1:95-667(-)
MKVEVEKDTKCTVDLYQHDNYQGWSATIIADNSKSSDLATFSYSLSDLLSYGFINDDMSAMKVNHESSCSVTLYQHNNFQGSSYGPFEIGDYTLSHLLARGFANDQVSSMIVTALDHEICVVELYQHGAYSGWQATITADNSATSGSFQFYYDMATLESAGFINDDMSAMKVTSLIKFETFVNFLNSKFL